MTAHKWEETEMSRWLKREHWRFYKCMRCGADSDAVDRSIDPNKGLAADKWIPDCDSVIVRKVMES